MPMTRVSDEGHAALVRLATTTGKTHGELIEDALLLLAERVRIKEEKGLRAKIHGR